MTQASLPSSSGPTGRTTPPRTLFLAAVCLVVPLLAVATVPQWAEGPGQLLIWLPALVPAFLLAYHRGWNGASLALAGGMAALVLSQVEVLLLDLPAPAWEVVFAVVLLLVLVAVGSGWLADLLQREQKAAERMALTDQLTGIPNRRHAMLFLEAAWSAARRGQPLAVVLFDVDHFKRVNDAHGHASGDDVLRVLGEVLSTRTRTMDLSARIGGEEFLSILANCVADPAVAFAEDVRGRLAEADFEWGHVTASAGVAVYEAGMGSPDVLLAAADRALYAAKQAGRDRLRRADLLDMEESAGAGGQPDPDSANPAGAEGIGALDGAPRGRRSRHPA